MTYDTSGGLSDDERKHETTTEKLERLKKMVATCMGQVSE